MRADGLPPEPTVGTDLRSVLPVASDDLGEGFRVISVEVYHDGLVVRWIVSPPDDDHWSSPPVAVSDDRGTRYRFVSGGGFGHGDAVRGDTIFVPAPPSAASKLTISHRRASVTVQLG